MARMVAGVSACHLLSYVPGNPPVFPPVIRHETSTCLLHQDEMSMKATSLERF